MSNMSHPERHDGPAPTMTVTLVRHGGPARGGDNYDPMDPALTQSGLT